jgi:pimeloyl-ACP methyl ester carboxylesterase
VRGLGGVVPQGFAEATYRSADGLALYYRDYPAQRASRFPVVCLPGLTRNSKDFEPLALRLTANHRVLSPDLRGRARSQWDPDWTHYQPPTYVRDVLALLAAADVERFAVIGTSLGGIIAMGLALAVPQRLIGVVLNDVGPEIDPRGIERIRGYSGKLPPVKTWAEAASQARATYSISLGEMSDAEWLEYCRRSYCERDDGTIGPDMDPRIGDAIRQGPTQPASMWPGFEALGPIPTLAIRGETSDLLSVETFRRMKEAKPDLAQLTVPGRGHAPILTEPVCVAAIERFLAALPQQG